MSENKLDFSDSELAVMDEVLKEKHEATTRCFRNDGDPDEELPPTSTSSDGANEAAVLEVFGPEFFSQSGTREADDGDNTLNGDQAPPEVQPPPLITISLNPRDEFESPSTEEQIEDMLHIMEKAERNAKNTSCSQGTNEAEELPTQKLALKRLSTESLTTPPEKLHKPSDTNALQSSPTATSQLHEDLREYLTFPESNRPLQTPTSLASSSQSNQENLEPTEQPAQQAPASDLNGSTPSSRIEIKKTEEAGVPHFTLIVDCGSDENLVKRLADIARDLVSTPAEDPSTQALRFVEEKSREVAGAVVDGVEASSSSASTPPKTIRWAMTCWKEMKLEKPCWQAPEIGDICFFTDNYISKFCLKFKLPIVDTGKGPGRKKACFTCIDSASPGAKSNRDNNLVKKYDSHGCVPVRCELCGYPQITLPLPR